MYINVILTYILYYYQFHPVLRLPFGKGDNSLILFQSQSRVVIALAFIFPRQLVDGTLFLIAHIVVIGAGNQPHIILFTQDSLEFFCVIDNSCTPTLYKAVATSMATLTLAE